MNEFLKSATAARKGIDNVPKDVSIFNNIIQLVDNVLDPLRQLWGKPIVVTSGYRCNELNRLIGGAKKSQHTLGQAADIRSLGDNPSENKKLLELLLNSGLTFDQVISEFPSKYGCPDWIHVSYNKANNRGFFMESYIQQGKTKYRLLKWK